MYDRVLPPIVNCMPSLLDWFQSTADDDGSPSVLLLDGGVSTYLEHVLAKEGRVFSNRALWSSSLLLDGEKGMIQDMHRAFCEAGADIVSTVTYQCHFFQTNEIDDDVMTTMMRNGVQWARSVVEIPSSCYVAASSGCYGAALADGSEYTGNYGDNVSLATLMDFHQRKFQVFLSSEESLDAIALETIPNLLECRAVVAMLTRACYHVVVWISLACQNNNDGLLNDGSKIEDALDIIEELDPDGKHVHGIGINCCDSLYVPSLLTRLVRHMARRNNRKRVILVYPNSGEEWDAQQSTWKEGTGCTTPTEFANRIVNAIQLVRSEWKLVNSDDAVPPKMIVGGCCRTSPTTIAAIRQRLNELNLRQTK